MLRVDEARAWEMPTLMVLSIGKRDYLIHGFDEIMPKCLAAFILSVEERDTSYACERERTETRKSRLDSLGGLYVFFLSTARALGVSQLSILA